MTESDIRRLIRDRVAAARLSPAAEASVVDELCQHVADRRRDLIAAGASEAEALARSLVEIEGHERLARDLRQLMPNDDLLPIAPEPARLSWSGVWSDLRYAVRTLRRSPGFAIAAIVTVALATGPTMAALGVANGTFWRPVPGIQDPDRLGIVWFGRWNSGGSFSPWRISYGHLTDMSKTFTAIAGIAGTKPESVNLTATDLSPRLVDAESVNASYFDLLGVRIAEGRAFSPEEDRDPSGAPVAVISDDLARTLERLGPVLGRTIIANGFEFTVIGVAPEGFHGVVTGRRTALWFTGMTAARLNHLSPANWAYEPHRGPFSTFVLRLAPGATFDQAQAELTAAARNLAATKTPGADIFESRGPTVFPGVGLEPFARERTWHTVRLLLVVGAVLIALGAANLANLFIFRTLGRTQEAAVRRALGASAARLARLHVIESLLISAIGAGCGLALALLSRSILTTTPIRGLGPLDLAVDWRLLALATFVATSIGVILGVAPARLAARASLTGAIAQRTRGSSRSGSRLRVGLAGAQLALSLMLFAGALLFVQTLDNLRRIDLGFVPDRVATLSFSFRTQGYAGAKAQQFFQELLPRLQARPEIEAVAVTQGVPMMGGGLGIQLRLPGRDPNAETTRVTLVDASAGFFRAMGIPILSGRAFTDAESFLQGPEPGVIVNRSLAQSLFGTDNAVGRSVIMPAMLGSGSLEATVIGIAGDVRWGTPDSPPDARVYRPYGFGGQLSGGMLVLEAVRPADALRIVRAEAARLDPNLPVIADQTMRTIIDSRLSQQRLFAWVLGVLATLGFLLAAVGVHGLVSQVVTERTREFGIRLALGATRRDVVRLVLRSGLIVISIGVPAGLAAAALSSRLVESQLFGVGSLDPIAYTSAAIALAAVVVAASLGPAIRASRGNPVDVLRSE